MRKAVVIAVFVGLLSVAAWAQQGGQEEIAVKLTPSALGTTTCSSTYSSGFEDSFFQWCVTANGNIAQFASPNEDIRAGAILEGYQICDVTPNVGYFDYASTDSGNWKAASLIQPNGVNTFPITVKRTTSDNHFILTQKFTQDVANRTVTVSMTIKNNTTAQHNVLVYRFADLDINGTFTNTFDNGVDSAWGYSPGTFGLQLALQTVDFGNAAKKYNLATGGALKACASPADPDGPVTEDGAVYIKVLVPLAAKASDTVVFNYRAM